MKKLSVIGATLVGALMLCAAPISLHQSQDKGLTLSVDKARARVGHPLTPGSVAGVHRRVERRAYRRGYYGGGYVGGYGHYHPYGYGYRRYGYYGHPYYGYRRYGYYGHPYVGGYYGRPYVRGYYGRPYVGGWYGHQRRVARRMYRRGY